MGGLATLFHLGGGMASPAAVRSMLNAVPYRGVDGVFVRGCGPIALGYSKLMITPEEEREQQPLVSPRTGCLLAADVRLDNREDLVARLGIRPAEASDAELILRAYERWDIDALPRLLGDFALLIWDPRRRRLLAARDTSGQRTLFYRHGPRAFTAASEIQQLLQDLDVPIEPDDERIREALTPFNILKNEKDQSRTYYKGIASLPAGHYLALDEHGLNVRRYWDLAPPRELRYRDDEQYAEHYRDLLFSVVRSRLRSSRPTGILLSGGLDSASIACSAQELYRRSDVDARGFVSLSCLFDGLACDERPFIEDVEAKYRLNAIHFAPGSFGGRLQPEPEGFRQSPNMGIAESRNASFGAAYAAGVRVLLTGDIADSCVAGSRLVFDSLLQHGNFGRFLADIRAYQRVTTWPLRTTLMFACLAPLLPLAWQRQLQCAYVLRTARRYEGRLLPTWMPEPLREDLSRRNLRLCLQAERARRFSSPARQLEYDLLYPPEVAPHPVPWPLEIWRPFADRRLHEFLLAIPPEQKYRPHPVSDEEYAGAKYLVRRAMLGIVPDSIRLRTSKTMFGDAFREELRLQWPLYEATFGPSARSRVDERGFVKQDALWSRLGEVMRGDQAHDFAYLMRIIELETWLRTFSLPRPRLMRVPIASSPALLESNGLHPANHHARISALPA